MSGGGRHAHGKTEGVGSEGEAPRDGARASGAEPTVAEKRARWLKLWAFATSPHGLGLTPVAFWASTRVELDALIEVYEVKRREWALTQALQANIHCRKKDDPPFTAEDFLGRADREKRVAESLRSRTAAMAATMALRKIKPGAPPTEDVPAWAIGPKHELQSKRDSQHSG